MDNKSEEKTPLELESFQLTSPGGHRYEISVSDSGSLLVTYKEPPAAKAPNEE